MSISKDLLDICEALEPTKFKNKNTYSADGIRLSFEVGDDESVLNIKLEGEGDKKVALETRFTDDRVSVADMEKIVKEHGMSICESADCCFYVDVSDDDYDKAFKALSDKFEVEEDEDELFVNNAASAEEISAVLAEVGIEAEVEVCEEDED